ncbi:MAG TPA: GlsB/YeaQ/YmgE family stress response membrane protein [Vicinamibacteria bacterium]|nr:GlsB/YeaQ/YmgE family stress response membrane protein [Vicinamibacteria bacterium]
MNFLWFAMVGIALGWLAGQMMKGAGFGLVGNLVVGALGAMLGGFLFSALGFSVHGTLAR